MDSQSLIFFSYASPDRDRVIEFHDYLVCAGFDVWLDVRRLKGGQNWNFEITRALQKAGIIVVFISNNSVDRRGYAQREIKVALDQARDRLIDDVYIIPVMLDERTSIPAQLSHIQVIKTSEDDCKGALAEAIQLQLERLGIEIERLQNESNVRWTMENYREVWEGLPGYDISFQLLKFSSEEYEKVAEITSVIRGWLMEQVMAQRQVKFSQSEDLCNFGQERSRRQNTWEAGCGEPIIKERVLSISYSVWWYGMGAAHPNQFFQTFSFTLNPVTCITTLEGLFSCPEEAFKVIQSEARLQLLSQKFGPDGPDDEVFTLEPGYVNSGTQEWSSFNNFVFTEKGIDLLFSCYDVAPYAFGPQFVNIEYEKIASYMHRHFISALGLEYIQWQGSQAYAISEAQVGGDGTPLVDLIQSPPSN